MYNKFILFFLLPFCLFSQSLWDDNYANLYSSKVNYRVNDSVKIIIDEKSSINYKSSVKSLKSFSLDIKSKDIVGVFDIVPDGIVEESKSSDEKDSFTLNYELQGRVVAVGNGFLTVSGVKNITLNNKNTRVELVGDVAFGDVKGNVIKSSNVMDLNLKITTILDNLFLPVSDEDFIAETEIVEQAGEDGGLVEVQVETGKYIITDVKKRELLLNYLNKILNVVF